MEAEPAADMRRAAGAGAPRIGRASKGDRPPSKRALRAAVLASLHAQGFTVHDGAISSDQTLDKDSLRALHAAAVEHAVEKSRHNLVRHEQRLLGHLADGGTLDPQTVSPRLVEVHKGTEEELLFRYARLHWSVPTSPGYGRRLRFLVIDQHNGKLIGLIGLGDPVFSLGPRDHWIGWDAEVRRTGLRRVMDAHVLGAVPPYSFLLAGKLVALLATSVEVREAFACRYAGRQTVISGAEQDGQLALITTVSALGRSSMYNRLRYRLGSKDRGRLAFEAVGFTRGSGEFHFSNGLYASLSSYALAHCQPTAKSETWGMGFRNRRELVGKALAHLGFSADWLYHGVSRQVFCAPLAANAAAFLRGEDRVLVTFEQSADELAAFWRERWLLPRAAREQRHRQWSPESWRLWPGSAARGRPPARARGVIGVSRDL
jgi:hypothetical protein